MSRLTHVNPGSAFKIGFATYGLLAGVIGLFGLLLGLLGLGFARDMMDIAGAGAGLIGMLIGYVINIILAGLFGGIGGLITAWIYNIVAGWTGGLEISLN